MPVVLLVMSFPAMFASTVLPSLMSLDPSPSASAVNFTVDTAPNAEPETVRMTAGTAKKVNARSMAKTQPISLFTALDVLPACLKYERGRETRVPEYAPDF